MSKTTMFSLFTQPHIFYTSKGVQKTNFLFAIFDKVEVAWYIYDENSEEFRLAEEADLLRDNFDTIGFLFYLWIIRYNYSSAFLQRWS